MSQKMTKLEAEKLIERANKVSELHDNPLFKELILDGYYKDEPARIASAITDFSMQDEIDQRELTSAMRSPGYVQQYFREIIRQGNVAAQSIENAKIEAENEEARIAEEMKETIVDPITGDAITVEG